MLIVITVTSEYMILTEILLIILKVHRLKLLLIIILVCVLRGT